MIRVFQCEHAVGNNPKCYPVIVNFYLPLKLIPIRLKRKLVFVEKFDAVMFSAGEFKGHHHVGNQKRMFKEHPANVVIFFAPRTGDAKLSFQKFSTFVAQTIDHRACAAAFVVFKLGAWPI